MRQYLRAILFLCLSTLAGPAHAVCFNPGGGEGDVIYNSTTNDLAFCDDAVWRAMGSGPKTGGGCANPAGQAGDVIFNSGYNMMQYCNSFEWVAMGPENIDGGYNIKTTGLSITKTYSSAYGYFDGRYADADIAGDLLITTDRYYDGIALWSLHDIDQPRFITFFTHAQLNGARDVDIVGNYAYVAAYDADRLTIVNISNRNSPTIAGSVTSTDLDGATSVKVAGNYAYVTAGVADRLTVVDISNPASPSIAGSVTSTNLDAATDLALSGTHAFVINASGTGANRRITAVDISNPASPSITGSLNNTTRFNGSQGIAIQGNYAYVTSATNDYLSIINISNPASMSLTGGVTDALLDDAVGVAVEGNYAYVMARNGVTVVNVSNPASPAISGSFHETYNEFNQNDGLAYANGRVYSGAVNNAELLAYNVTTPASPTLVGRAVSYMQPLGISDAVVDGNYMYAVQADGDGFAILDVTNPLMPTVIAALYACEYANDLVKQGNYVYVACADGLTIVNVTSKIRPTISGYYANGAATQNSYAIAVDGNYVYQAFDNQNRFTVINVSNPASPTLAGTITDSDLLFCYSMDKSGSHVFLSCANDIISINVSNPASPAITSRLSGFSGTYSDIIINGNYAFASSYSLDAVVSIDISNPASMSFVDYVFGDELDGTSGLDFVEGYILATGENMDFFTVVDVRDPANISLASVIQDGTSLDYAYKPVFVNGFAHVMGTRYAIIDMRDLNNGCHNPEGQQGDMIYNSTHDVIQYCSGRDWVAAGQ